MSTTHLHHKKCNAQPWAIWVWPTSIWVWPNRMIWDSMFWYPSLSLSFSLWIYIYTYTYIYIYTYNILYHAVSSCIIQYYFMSSYISYIIIYWTISSYITSYYTISSYISYISPSQLQKWLSGRIEVKDLFTLRPAPSIESWDDSWWYSRVGGTHFYKVLPGRVELSCHTAYLRI